MQLQKLKVTKLDCRENELREEAREFLYNPTQLTIGKSAGLASARSLKADTPVEQSVGGRERTISFELFLDQTDLGMQGTEGARVREDVDFLMTLVSLQPPRCGDRDSSPPPPCRIQWGEGLKPMGVILESVQATYTLFAPNGIPLRARVNLSMREFVSPKRRSEELGATGSRTRTRFLKRGDTLANIAAEEFGDPALWRRLADANRLLDPRRLEPGVILLVPTE